MMLGKRRRDDLKMITPVARVTSTESLEGVVIICKVSSGLGLGLGLGGLGLGLGSVGLASQFSGSTATSLMER